MSDEGTLALIAAPAGARLKGRNILQPEAMRTLFSVDTRLLRGKRVFDDLIYTFRFAEDTAASLSALLGRILG